MKLKYNSGYGALLFVLITGISLMTFLTEVSSAYADLRSALYDYVYKKQSVLLAIGCRDIALSLLAEDPDFFILQPKKEEVGELTCTITRIEHNLDIKQLETSGEVHGQQTKIRTEVKLSDHEIIRLWSKEIF